MIKIGFDASLIRMVHSYLQDRTFYVKIGDTKSSLFEIPYGVPQGGVLSPLLYNLYVSDAPRSPSCIYGFYADDTAVLSKSRYANEIITNLQQAFESLVDYFKLWKITVNSDKTQALFFTTRRIKQLPEGPITLGGKRIDWGTEMKYLGFHFTPNLLINRHIETSIFKSSRALGSLYPFLGRRSTLNKELKITLYHLYIRSILTYAAPLLVEAAPTSIAKLQVLQNRVLRLILQKGWRTRISLLHEESHVPRIHNFLLRLDATFLHKCSSSENLLIRGLTAT